MAMSATKLELLSRAQCLELLTTEVVGRVGVSIAALPVVLPVNYILVVEDVVFRTISGTKLDSATRNAVVAFEVDKYAPDGSWGWSVLVQGRCAEVTAASGDVADLAKSSLRAWAFDDGVATRWVRVESSFVSGRRFRRQVV